MKPLKLTMTAFGPYKNREVIDFTKLKNNRIFVISGNTGAGKTTIFDAICFALYGSASGEDRNDSKFLRSDFADDDVHTSVELEFELHDRCYRIRRQLPHVKKGNKSATGEQYEFYEKVKDREIPCVDRQIVSEINKKVEDLVGLTKDQFSQIVMLPQGEFRKLLTSQTENKEEILRKIFRTEPYQLISERLKEKKKLAEEDYKREAQTRNRYMEDIKATLPERSDSKLFEILSWEHFNTNQVLTGLDEEHLFYQNEIVKHNQLAEASGKAYNQKLEEFHKAEALNERFGKLEQKQDDLQKLAAQVPVFKEREARLEKAFRASQLEAYEQQVNEWREDEKTKQRKLLLADQQQETALKQLKKAQTAYTIEENKKTDREELVRMLDRFTEFLPIVKKMDSKKAELFKRQQEVQELTAEVNHFQEKIQAEKSAKVQLSSDIKAIEQAVDQLADKQQKLTEMRDRVRVLQDYLKWQEQQMELEKKFQTKEAGYQAVRNQYEMLEEAWVSGQAAILAAHLQDGQPCPVCGSTGHPKKAQGQNSVPTKEELEAVKKELERTDQAYRETAAKLNTIREQLQSKAAEVAEIGVSVPDAPDAYNELVEAGKALKKDVELLAKEKLKRDRLKDKLEKTEKTLALFEAQHEEKAKAYQVQNTAFETQKAVYQAQLNRIPEEFRILGVLQQKISETQALKAKMEQNWETSQTQLQQAKEADTKAAVNLTAAKNQLAESSAKKSKSETQFLEELQRAHFPDEQAYREAKMSEMDRRQCKIEIDDFHKNLGAVKQQVAELQLELKDKTKADIAALESKLGELKQAWERAQELVRQTEQHLEKVTELKEKILDTEQKTADLEIHLNIIADLYDVVRGQNSSKISFERYLQIEYLEQIIVAANERLKHISNGQFLLMRSERQESRGKQSGLGLDVYDAYTGQTRDVKTLSGGEKFNASLCLALGMADVIQSFQGSVAIDTMFIDEGFGTLDEEALNKAIDTLIDLQQTGRMIGIISHVQELKNMIPAILEVKKTKEGCSETEFVIR